MTEYFRQLRDQRLIEISTHYKSNTFTKLPKINTRVIRKLFNGADILKYSEFFYDHQKEDLTFDYEFNNWIDIYGKGIWGWSQKQVNFWGKELALNLFKQKRSYKRYQDPGDRWFICADNDQIILFFFGRDTDNLSDCIWVIENKGQLEEVL